MFFMGRGNPRGYAGLLHLVKSTRFAMTSLYREASCHCETHVFYGAWQSKRLCWIASPRKKHEVRNDESVSRSILSLRDPCFLWGVAIQEAMLDCFTS